MSLRVLQFGASGQLARELTRQAQGCDLALTVLSRGEADLSDPRAAAAAVEAHRPDLVINAAAYTAVDRAETEAELAQAVNADAPGAMAQACDHVGAALVHISTDYVFAGDKGAPYLEGDATGPLNVYGASKLAGEAAVLSACARACVIRTSWVVSAHGQNFVKTMRRLAAGEAPVRVVDDQFGRPTAAADLAGFILTAAPRWAAAQAGDPVFGLLHFANGGETTWRGLAQAVFDLSLGAGARTAEPIPTSAFPRPAPRPARGTLDTARLTEVFGVTPRPWREALADIIAELSAEEVHA
ncbi:MAG: dTDP-4-dehydrorhamnose reductase [Phenylobacterium sp.]|uniref:dTDP-4-dehydrorhamnose reductase n=1 Tax=Phenylobacterium sp. TaxID=1871053 RepID=UPI00391AA96B